MNRSLQDIGGGLLLVPQFTLAADTRKGMRPSLTPAADPSQGERLFAYLGERARARHPTSFAHELTSMCAEMKQQIASRNLRSTHLLQ